MNHGFTMERPFGRTGGDSALLGTLFLLVGLGIASLFSASYGYAMSLGKSGGYFAMRQVLWLVPATVAFGFGAVVSLELLQRFIGTIVLGSMILLLLPFMPVIGISKNGASRWFGFNGLMFQPAELFKVVLVLYLAHILSKKAEKLRDVINGIFPPLLVVAIGMLIVLAQNDFSTAMLLGFLAIVMFWIAEVPVVFFVALTSIGLPLVSLAVLTSDYRLKRVLGFLAPGFDPADLSYQVNGSLRAISAGGIWGKGLGQGTLKIRSIPLVQSDFVFSAWTEETGFVGVLAFAALWAFFLWRAFKTAFAAPDSFRSHFAFGLACYLAIQTLINVMVASGTLPATGIPLPFFSSGGSSLLSVSLAAGFLFNMSRHAVSDHGSEGLGPHV